MGNKITFYKWNKIFQDKLARKDCIFSCKFVDLLNLFIVCQQNWIKTHIYHVNNLIPNVKSLWNSNFNNNKKDNNWLYLLFKSQNKILFSPHPTTRFCLKKKHDKLCIIVFNSIAISKWLVCTIYHLIFGLNDILTIYSYSDIEV